VLMHWSVEIPFLRQLWVALSLGVVSRVWWEDSSLGMPGKTERLGDFTIWNCNYSRFVILVAASWAMNSADILMSWCKCWITTLYYQLS
jgi:hypothetical protein